MEHFSATVEGNEVEISNVVMIQDEATDLKQNAVMITDPQDGETFLTGDVLFEAQFENPEDSEAFYKLMKKAKIVTVGL
jgi:hypothetical protein